MNKINNNSTRAEVLKAVKINGLKIINANKKFLKDKVIVLTAINQRYSVIAKLVCYFLTFISTTHFISNVK